MAWILKGEQGATLDETSREMHSINIDEATLRFESLGNDELTWSALTEDATGAGTIVPDNGQVVELWKDSARKFRGHVLFPRVGSKSITIKVAGPWWWMTRIPLTDEQEDETGVMAERMNYVFQTGSHKAKVEALINRAIVQGVPMRLGTVDATFDTPNMSLSEMNCAQAMAELMAWLPDAVVWFDYSDITGNGYPLVNVTRRGNMPATSYAVGVDAVIDTNITPRLDLEVTYSRLDYVVRNATTGRPNWASQASGTEVDGKRQIVTVSGPEITDFLPPELAERMPIYFSSTSVSEVITAAIPELQKLFSAHPVLALSNGRLIDPNTGSLSARRMNGGAIDFNSPASATGGRIQTTPTIIASDKTAILLGLDGQTPPPDWLLEDFGLTRLFVQDFQIRDTQFASQSPPTNYLRRIDLINSVPWDIYMNSQLSNGSGAGQAFAWFIRSQNGDDLPIYLIDTADLPAVGHSGIFASGTSSASVRLASGASSTDGDYVGRTIFWIRNRVRYGAVINSYTGATQTATLKGGDVQTSKAPAAGQAYEIAAEFISRFSFDFLVPPPGLAAGLQAAQNWVPWEGPISLIADEVSGDNLLNQKYNLTNTLLACAEMNTLARSISHDIFGGVTTIDLGAPARSDFGTLTSRIRRQPRDNIVYL